MYVLAYSPLLEYSWVFAMFVVKLTVAQVFRNSDRNHDGKLDREEFRCVLESKTLNLKLSAEEIEYLYQSADMNGDGMISYVCVCAASWNDRAHRKSSFLHFVAFYVECIRIRAMIGMIGRLWAKTRQGKCVVCFSICLSLDFERTYT